MISTAMRQSGRTPLSAFLSFPSFSSFPFGSTVLGALSLINYILIAWLSHSFIYGQGHQERPIGGFVCLYFVACSVYAVAVWRVQRQVCGRGSVALVMFFAVLFRLVFFFSEPIQEDDFYRYLWDGKVVASGLNPYRFAPLDVQMSAGIDGPIQPYRDIADEDEQFAFVLSRVNHPGVPTIYPPVAQVVFGLTALVAPGSLLALRVAFLFFDIGVCLVIIGLLRHLDLSPVWVLIYAWSPMVIKEVMNSPHYDVVPTFLLVLALFALVTDRRLLAFSSLGGAILGKVFPLVLLPLFAYRTWRQHGLRTGCGGLAVTSLVIYSGYAPFVSAGSGLWQGSITFAEQWQTNSFVFPLLLQLTSDRWVANGLVVMCIAGAVIIALWRNSRGGDEQFLCGCFFVIGTLLLLSPVGNPWYFTWAIPFVCLFPRLSWLLLSGLLGLYYFVFYFLYRGEPDTFQWVIWLEYVPFYMLLAWEWWQVRTGRPLLANKTAV